MLNSIKTLEWPDYLVASVLIMHFVTIFSV
jgi:hypothetical protein